MEAIRLAGDVPSLSVVIAAYNERGEVRKTVESALALQGEVGKLQVIVVDDMSSDGCCEGLPKEVKLIRNGKREGCGRSHNIGAKAAEGDVLVFPDAHMRFAEGTFRNLGRACLQNGALACTGVRGFTGGTQGWGANFRYHREGRLGVQYFRPKDGFPGEDFAYRVGMPFGGCYAFHKDFFRAIGGWLDVAAIWGYCEQPLGALAWLAGKEVYAIAQVTKHLFRKVNPAGATVQDIWKNVAYSHGAIFEDSTNRFVWGPILRKYLEEKTLTELLTKASEDGRRARIQKFRVRTDESFFKERLGVRPLMKDGKVRGILKSSVVLPAYNEGKEVLLTMRSLGRSTRNDPEFIIVDDASTDGSCRREVEITGKDGSKTLKQVYSDGIRILRSDRRRGVCRSRRTGVAAASEDVLLFLDAHSRCEEGDLERLRDAAYDTKGFVVGAISGFSDTKPPRKENRKLYGGYFTVKPKWGLRLDYHKGEPEKDLTRITGPIGSCYAVRRDVLKALRNWPPLPGAWAYSEQGIGLKAYNLGIPVYCLSSVHIHHKMKRGTIDVPQVDVLLNAHFVHRAYFDEDTYTDIWRPLLLEHGFDPKIDEMLKSKVLLDEAAWFQANRRHTDEMFFRNVLGKHVDGMLQIDEEKGRAIPTTKAGYIAYEARRAPSREWTADRPRMIRHINDLIGYLKGVGIRDLRRVIHLDLGSRDGWILDHLVEMGFKKGRVHGMELSPWAAKHAREMGRDVDQGDIHDLGRWKDRTFTLVTAIHSLEHCPKPIQVLREAFRVLRPGGIFMVVVPLEPKGISLQGDHCHSMKSAEYVREILGKAGFVPRRQSILRDELTIWATKPS